MTHRDPTRGVGVCTEYSIIAWVTPAFGQSLFALILHWSEMKFCQDNTFWLFGNLQTDHLRFTYFNDLFCFFGKFYYSIKVLLSYRISSCSVHTQKWVWIRFCTYETLQCMYADHRICQCVFNALCLPNLHQPPVSVSTILRLKKTLKNKNKKTKREKKFHSRNISTAYDSYELVFVNSFICNIIYNHGWPSVRM